MKLPLFKLEEYLAKTEFSSQYLLSCSDAQTISLKELLEMADPESRRLWDTLSLGYTESRGHPLLKEEIADLYEKISSDQVLTFAGAEDGIYCFMQTLVSPRDHVIAIGPAYQSLIDLPRSLGAEMSVMWLKEEEQWKLDLDALAALFRPNTKLVVINFPHNPTGAIPTLHEQKRLIDLCRKSNAYLFSDEVYRYMEIDEKDRLPAICDVYERGISLSVMSKAFGLAGLRIGWIATQDLELLNQVALYKHYTSICNSGLSEIATIMALRAKEKILSRNLQIMRSNLSLLDAFVQKHRSLFHWVRPKGGCIAFPRLLTGEPIEAFCRRALEKKSVLLMPAEIFSFPSNHFRIGFGRKNMPEALEKFDEFLHT